jgi:hypothetical protein
MKSLARSIAQIAVIGLSAVPLLWVGARVVDAHHHPSQTSHIHAPDRKR